MAGMGWRGGEKMQTTLIELQFYKKGKERVNNLQLAASPSGGGKEWKSNTYFSLPTFIENLLYTGLCAVLYPLPPSNSRGPNNATMAPILQMKWEFMKFPFYRGK